MDKDFNDELNRHLLEKELGIDLSGEEDVKGRSDEPVPPGRETVIKTGIYDWLQCLICAIIIGIIVFLFVGRVITVDGSSMYSTLFDGDKMLATDIFYKPENGDIIICRSSYYDKPLVKRVIATEGQTIEIDFDHGVVYVDGEMLNEPYINEPTYIDEGFSGKATVPEGCVFVMGDNRNDSNDSRKPEIGFIDEREIMGKVHFILIPASESGGIDWSRFGSVY